MKIQKVTGRNFYSFKNFELDLEKYSGILKINGKNRDSGGSNGAGKSVIFDGIVWGLFGKTIRRSTEESLVSSHTGKDTEISLSISKNHSQIEIIRTKRPTSLNLIVDGENRNRESAVETQKLIEELLQTDYKSFMASVVFGQHTDISFLDSSPEDKRNIIKNCFNLEEFFSKRTSIKQLKSKYSAELKVWNTLLENLKKEQDTLNNHIPDKKYKYVELPSLQSILDAEKRIQEIETDIFKLQRELKQISNWTASKQEILQKGIYEKIEECPICKSSYCKKQTEETIANAKQAVEAWEIASQAINLSILELREERDKLNPPYSRSLWAKYNDKNKLVLDAQKHIDRLTEVSKQISDQELNIQELNKKLEVMKFWELAFSEKGIIRYIIRNILDYFNMKTNEYISILTNNQFNIEFSDDLSETIKNCGREVKYISLSGGEKRKINLSIMLALQDLSSKISKTDCNLIFFDEVCDNIDDSGIEAINNLLNTLKEVYKDKILFIITHNNRLQNLLNEERGIMVEKLKGISSIV
jgi:DNA repair exonuclease SbcCD ATPase subunit